MGDFNYCLVTTNKLYAEIQDMLDLEEISMNNPNDNSKIFYNLGLIVKKAKYIEVKPLFNGKDELLEQLFVDITDKVKDKEGFQGNTLMILANTSYSYEVIYLEDLSKKQTDNELNELATISNIELEPIFNDCGIVKISYETGTHIHSQITSEDIENLIINCFYHKGVVILEDGSMKELDFPGDKPDIILGNVFKKGTPFFLAGIQIEPYNETGNKLNEKASEFLGIDVKGIVFFAVLSPMGGKKFWNMEIPTMNMLLQLANDKDKLTQIDNELDEKNKACNPFFLIKKYCI
jgi:hypothetical protein